MALLIDTGMDQDYDNLCFFKKSRIYNHLLYRPLLLPWPGLKPNLNLRAKNVNLFLREP